MLAQTPELLFGLIGPLGTDLNMVSNSLQDSLKQVRYDSEVHRLSSLMRDLSGKPWNQLTDGPRDKTIDAHMSAGNELRRLLGRNDAMAMLGMLAIQELRKAKTQDRSQPISSLAHILYSLKRPEEVRTLRRIHGPAFVTLAAYSPRTKRVDDLASKIASSYHNNQSKDFTTQAEQLVKRDESEIGEVFGQNVEDTFPFADIIIDISDPTVMKRSIQRAVELLFGNVFNTPSADEQGMYFARSASLRSASLARQVGAAICRQDGSLVALGMNEVPKAHGGAYWDLDVGDSRDFKLGFDTSDKMRANVFAEILQRLQKAGWLSEERSKSDISGLVDEALRVGDVPVMKGAQLFGTIDYVRAVHAEMAAITDATRHGVSTKQCILYTTTFPCHDCAKHIIAAGIERVVYIEPYRKSLVQDLYKDSIVVDPIGETQGKVRFEPFVGVAPRRYSDLFGLSTTKRKSSDGSAIQWRSSDAVPRLPEYMPSTVTRLVAEEEEIAIFFKQLAENGLAKLEDRTK